MALEAAGAGCLVELLLVDWLDSFRHSRGWDSVESHAGDSGLGEGLSQSVGWLVVEDEVSLSLAQSRGLRGGVVCDVMQIPKGCVRRRVVLG